jgi:predicted anti-sigma-YlaC factor YlaD
VLRGSESDCEPIRRLASIQLDCELSELGVRRLHRHLDDCAPCSEFATSITATTNALRDSRRSLVRLEPAPPA